MGYTRFDYQNNKQQYGGVSFESSTSNIPVSASVSAMQVSSPATNSAHTSTPSSGSIRSFKSTTSTNSSSSPKVHPNSPLANNINNNQSIKLISQLIVDFNNDKLDIDKTLDTILDDNFCSDIITLKDKMSQVIKNNNNSPDQIELELITVITLGRILETSDISSSNALDSKNINVSVPTPSDFTVMKTIQLLKQLKASLNRIVKDPKATSELATLIQLFNEGPLYREAITLYCHHHPEILEILYSQSLSLSVAKSPLINTDIGLSARLKYYLLTKISAECIIDFPLVGNYSNQVKNILTEVNNPNFINCLGYNQEKDDEESCFNYKPTQLTMSVLFEVIDHNLSLDLNKEKNLLQYLKASLVNINENVDNESDFLKLNKLLNDVGSRLSIHALFENLQFILASYSNKSMPANKMTYKLIPSFYNKEFGFEFIVPVGKSNFMFEDNLNFGLDSTKNSRFKSLELCKDIENSIEIHQQYCTELIQHCLVLCCVIKQKIYTSLKKFNDSMDIMKFSTKSQSQLSADTDSTSIYKFRNKDFTQLAMFKSGHGLDFKVMYHSLELNICATASTIILQDNLINFTNEYNALSTTDLLNVPVANILYNLQIQSLRNFLSIYKDFGLISLFKYFQQSMLHDLRLIPCYSQTLTDLIISESGESLSTSITATTNGSGSNTGANSTASSNGSSPAMTTAACGSTNSTYSRSSLSRSQQAATSSSQTTSTSINSISDTIQQSSILSNLLRQMVEMFDDGKTVAFKRMVTYLKKNPSPIKPSKIEKGTAMLDLNKFAKVLGYKDETIFFSH